MTTAPRRRICDAGAEGTAPRRKICDGGAEGTAPRRRICDAGAEGTAPRRKICDAGAESTAPGAGSLKRALTDPRLLSGIGNVYSDEILHRAGTRRPSPMAWGGHSAQRDSMRIRIR